MLEGSSMFVSSDEANTPSPNSFNSDDKAIVFKAVLAKAYFPISDTVVPIDTEESDNAPVKA